MIVPLMARKGCPYESNHCRAKEAGDRREEDIPEPDARDGSVLVEAIAVGVCGTDVEIVDGKYGWAPPGKTRLVLGPRIARPRHRSGPRGLKKGDLVVGIVRRPDPLPCPNCAVGEWDMCRNGQYTERGIKEIDGYMSERWRIEPEYAMKIDPALGMLGVLLEPTTVVAKAWEQFRRSVSGLSGNRGTVLVTGAGPIGLLAALIGKQHGIRSPRAGPGDDRAEAGNCSRSRSDVPLLHGPEVGSSRTSSSNVPASVRSSPNRSGSWCRRRRVPHRRRTWGRTYRNGAADVASAAVLKNNVVVRKRKRQQAALVQGRRSSGPRGPRLAGAA